MCVFLADAAHAAGYSLGPRTLSLMARVPSFMAEQCSIASTCHSLFVHSPVGGHLGRFHSWPRSPTLQLTHTSKGCHWGWVGEQEGHEVRDSCTSLVVAVKSHGCEHSPGKAAGDL